MVPSLAPPSSRRYDLCMSIRGWFLAMLAPGLAVGLAFACGGATGGGGAVPDAATQTGEDGSGDVTTAVTDSAAASDAACPGPSGAHEGPSCAGGLTCAQGSCCESPLVEGGTYMFTPPSSAPGAGRVTLSSFRLDKYEVTVGRFRKFVDAVVKGWRPTPGSGKHHHVAGCAIQGVPSPESGWDPSWPDLPGTKVEWDSELAPDAGMDLTWTPEPGPNENRPIWMETWFEAYAFCIWDEGFLPTQREWQYAFVGGVEERKYPWTGDQLTCTDATYENTCGPRYADVGRHPLGNARWGQADLVGSVSEWLLDRGSVGFGDPGDCVDCATLWPVKGRVIAGWDDWAGGPYIWPDPEGYKGYEADTRGAGFRCARAP